MSRHVHSIKTHGLLLSAAWLFGATSLLSGILWIDTTSHYRFALRSFLAALSCLLVYVHVRNWSTARVPKFAPTETIDAAEFDKLPNRDILAQLLDLYLEIAESRNLSKRDRKKLLLAITGDIPRARVKESITFDGGAVRRNVDVRFQRAEQPIQLLSRPAKGDRYGGFKITQPDVRILNFQESQALTLGLLLEVCSIVMKERVQYPVARQLSLLVTGRPSSPSDEELPVAVARAFHSIAGRDPLNDEAGVYRTLLLLMNAAHGRRLIYVASSRGDGTGVPVATFSYLEGVQKSSIDYASKGDPWMRFKHATKQRLELPTDLLAVPATRALSSRSYTLVIHPPKNCYIGELLLVEAPATSKEPFRPLPNKDREFTYTSFCGRHIWPGARRAEIDTVNLGAVRVRPKSDSVGEPAAMRDPVAVASIFSLPNHQVGFSALMAVLTLIVVAVTGVTFPYGNSDSVDLVAVGIALPGLLIAFHQGRSDDDRVVGRSGSSIVSLWISGLISVLSFALYLWFGSRKVQTQHFFDLPEGKRFAMMSNGYWALLFMVSCTNAVWMAAKYRVSVLRHRLVIEHANKWSST